MVSAGLDLLMHLNVESGIDAGASTPEKPSIEMNNPFAAFMGAAQGKKSAEKEKRSEEEEDDGWPTQESPTNATTPAAETDAALRVLKAKN